MATEGIRDKIPYEASMPIARWLVLPALFTGFSLYLWIKWEDVADRVSFLRPVIGQRVWDDLPDLIFLVSLTVLAIRLAQSLAQIRLGHRPPRLVRQIVAVIAWTISAGVAVASLWDVPIGSLLTTSGLLVAVLGIALKNMISDLFNGVSLPVKVGDWIEVQGMSGRIVEISWRATKLLTTDHVETMVPNTFFIEHPFRNYSGDRGYYLDRFQITLPSSVTAYQVTRILMGAASQIDAVAAYPEPPEPRILSFTDAGVLWELRYPVSDPDQALRMRHRIHRVLLRDLSLSGVELPVAPVQVQKHLARSDKVIPPELQFLRMVDLFGTLTEGELAIVCERMQHRTVSAGVPVVRQDEKGESLFILRQGLLSAAIRAGGKTTEVGRIRPGEFFGEMSLLTGALRSATVTPLVESKVFEIDRDVIAPIFLDRPEIAAMVSDVLAERQLVNAPKLAGAGQADAARESLAQQFLGKITAFFRLPAK